MRLRSLVTHARPILAGREARASFRLFYFSYTEAATQGLRGLKIEIQGLEVEITGLEIEISALEI